MNKALIIGVAVFAGLHLFGCAGSKVVSKENPEPQASVLITMNDGVKKAGIIFKSSGGYLKYVDAQEQKLDSLRIDYISSITKLDKYFDFQGRIIPKSEIKSHKKLKRTLLYGGGGLILGAAAGTGLSIVLFAEDSNQGAALTAIGLLGGAGAWLFGSMGSDADFDDAVFAARKARGQEVSERLKKLEEEKARLEKK